jgi:hypothetical protein
MGWHDTRGGQEAIELPFHPLAKQGLSLCFAFSATPLAAHLLTPTRGRRPPPQPP